MTGAPTKLYRIKLARYLRDGLVVAGTGIAIGLLVTIGEDARSVKIGLFLSCVTALSLFLFSNLLIHASWPFLGCLGRGRQVAGVALVFIASGVLGWLVMMLTARLALGIDYSRRPIFLAVTVACALAVGFAFFAFHRLRLRLEESVARVKEVEFAEKELQLARALQSRLLPPAQVEGGGFRVAARNLPARVVAGDFFDVFQLPDGALGVAVADVAGKGMAAALVMASVKAMLPLVCTGRSVAEALRELNRRLAAELSAREFVALALVRFEPQTGRISLGNAGLPDPYLIAGGGNGPGNAGPGWTGGGPGGESMPGPRAASGTAPRALAVPGPRLPLGIRPSVDYETLELELAEGERLMLLTDGLPEAPTASGEPLGYDRLAEMLAGGESGPPLAWLDALLGRLREATGPDLEDDWTALLLERTALEVRRGGGVPFPP
jgi:hypothetical protein